MCCLISRYLRDVPVSFCYWFLVESRCGLRADFIISILWNLLRSVLWLRIWFTLVNSAWEECISCRCRRKYSIDVNLHQLMDGLFGSLVSFLTCCPLALDIAGRRVFKSPAQEQTNLFLFVVPADFPRVFDHLVFKCMHIKDGYVLENWPFYHHWMSFFKSLVISLALKSALSEINMATSASLWCVSLGSCSSPLLSIYLSLIVQGGFLSPWQVGLVGGVSSRAPKACGFHSWSGHIPRLWV